MTIESLLHRSPPKSRFVTIVAWIGIFSGASTVVGAAWSLVMEPSVAPLAALPAGLMASFAGIGLNERREWARQAFIIVQAYGILYLLIDTVFVIRRHAGAGAGSAAPGVAATAVVILLVFVALNAWIIAKLCSRRIRAEFEAAEDGESE